MELKVQASRAIIEPMVHSSDLRSGFAQRLKKAISAAGWQDWGAGARLAKATGVTAKAASKWLNGEAVPGPEKLLKLADELGVRREWLEYGEGLQRHSIAAADSREAPNTEPAPANRGNIPLISWVQAGSFHEAVEAYAPGMAEKYLPCPVPHSDWTFALRVRGDSMFNPHGGKSFSEGDIIYCDPEVEAINRSFVVVKMVDEQEATFKQLVVEGTFRYLKALNPSWPEPFVRIDSEAVILGVVIAKLEQF
ncbi:LexA family protein [Pseudomonas oryzihabitans]|uniref:LexA family protein n=1 Tax=Pseudomonas oryzihabitans TaxID=47885 RepID=UPI001DE7CCF6|nr:S24 family peptidase [Pseudomonas oryzihabitans]HJE71429.1 helix-turn-helix domain-containing protein [Pseudomonas oryzihabitans]